MWRSMSRATLVLVVLPLAQWSRIVMASDENVYLASPALNINGSYTNCPCVWWNPVGHGAYGNRCQSWDPLADSDAATVAACNESAGPAPAWCVAKWCYVDPATCKRPMVPVQMFTKKVMPVAKSFATCGNLGMDSMTGMEFSNRDVRPIYVFADGAYASNEQPLGEDTDLGRRAALKFADLVLKTMGFQPEQIKYRQLSDASLRLFNKSRFTACVHDIALGNLDLCVGDMLDLDVRRAMNVSFTGSIFVEEFYLVINNTLDTRHKVVNIVAKTFQPFTTQLWIVLVCTMVLCILVMIAFEEFGPGKQKNFRNMSELATASIHSMMAGEVTFMPVTIGGKVFSAGYGFFILVCISCYTANMATILVSTRLPSGLNSIEAAVDSGNPICHHAALPMEELRAKNPALAKLSRSIDDTQAGNADKMLTQCNVSIMSKYNLKDYWANGRFCDRVVLDEKILMSFPNGFYASEFLARELSWTVSRLRQQGQWEATLQGTEVPSKCHELPQGPNMQLNSTHLLGAFVILVVALVIGCAAELFPMAWSINTSYLRQWQKDDEDSDRSFESGSELHSLEEKFLDTDDLAAEEFSHLQRRVQKARQDTQHRQNKLDKSQRRLQHMQEKLQAHLEAVQARSPKSVT